MRQKTRFLTVVSIVLIVFLLASVSLSVVLALKLSEADTSAMASKTDREQFESELSGLQEQLAQLSDERQEMETKISELETEKQLLSDGQEQKDELYASLNERIRELESSLDSKQSEIDALNRDIKSLEGYINIDINAQIKIVNKLNELLAAPPERIIKTTVEREDGTTETQETREPGIIAIYYEDIENGYTFSYNSGWVTSSASMLKAPFALSVFESYAARDAVAAEGGTYKENLISLDSVFTYTSDKYRSGSGKIKDEPEGSEYSYLELLEYMLKYSDNVAYYELRNTYGIDNFRALAVKLGCSGMMGSLSNMSVTDAGKVTKAIYSFVTTDKTYGPVMLAAMKSANHTVMIPAAISGAEVAHKYGWDTAAYHDMAIVFREHPYVVSVMSNLDQGGDEVNSYIRSLISQIDAMHANFYK